MKRQLALLSLLCIVLSGCTNLNTNKNFPRAERQKFVDKFVYFESHGFGGFYKPHKEIEFAKGKWSGKCLVLFLPNIVAEHPSIVPEFHEFPDDWKAANFSEVDTLVLLEFRGGVQEKLLNQKPKKLRLVMSVIDVKKKVIRRKVKIESWEPGEDRAKRQRDLPSIKETLEKIRKS